MSRINMIILLAFIATASAQYPPPPPTPYEQPVTYATYPPNPTYAPTQKQTSPPYPPKPTYAVPPTQPQSPPPYPPKPTYAVPPTEPHIPSPYPPTNPQTPSPYPTHQPYRTTTTTTTTDGDVPGIYNCDENLNGKKYPITGNCVDYFECVNGESLYRVCDEGYSFDKYYQQCVYDPSCVSVTAPEPYVTTSRPYQPPPYYRKH